MKILFAYNCWSDDAKTYHENIARNGRAAGLDVSTFVATPNPPSVRYSWPQLDRAWSKRDRALCRMKDSLLKAVDNVDVFWLYNGANIHPEWLAEFPRNVLKIYGCFDDPESSHTVSQPVAGYFDSVFVGNIAALPLYQGWGCKHVAWGPIFLEENPPKLFREDVEASRRPVDFAFLGERQSPWRKTRLDYVQQSIPQGLYYGRGWPNGFCSREERNSLYRKMRIGINIHNSIGPINIRLFTLPAFGVMQVCDNKCRLGHVFNLREEVIGFDTVKEGVELVRYYLDHEEERAEIAWKGYVRYEKDYAPIPLWNRYRNQIHEWLQAKKDEKLAAPAPYVRERKEKLVTPVKLAKQSLQKTRRLARSISQTITGDDANELPATNYNNPSYSQIETSPFLPYVENPPVGPVNFAEKVNRQMNAGFFEWPNMVALNWAVATLVGDARRIVEIGGGTGCFAFEAAQDPLRTVLCLEDDSAARAWAIKHRSLPNIVYDSQSLENLSPDFDLLVSVDVVEHIKEYNAFLQQCKRLARKAILTTPNRFREVAPKLKPDYKQHVREWSAGEFYYTLKAFWDSVILYAMPNVYAPILEQIDINSTLTPLIAVCEQRKTP